MDRHIGSLFLFSGGFAPEGSVECDGSELPISENQSLYSLLSTTYGGDGVTTFRVPDLRDRVPVQGSARGALTTSLDVATGDSTVPVPGRIAMKWCIVTAGIFPPRG